MLITKMLGSLLGTVLWTGGLSARPGHNYVGHNYKGLWTGGLSARPGHNYIGHNYKGLWTGGHGRAHRMSVRMPGARLKKGIHDPRRVNIRVS